ncbi:hypothetical protein DNH61_24650 [Paenibacillus sambharensis]|uniref:Uncharacterized protein n=1 Tax=Paenibacillus sambharensis TaxID=1803190 RepID=A0A2W1LDI8_9BACL|nr:hypothetical protein [Paenibacillus sambharensis]PZD93125.1 hypothetical protein DNH61_24650 [Paenibacillus sambharensis]
MNYVHDNEILSYQIELSNQVITFKTKYNDEIIEIIFTGVMAHMFVNELPGSIILDIGEYPVSLFIEENQILLDERKDYCWPRYYDNVENLYALLINEGYVYYIISSSYGLNGWILAKKVEVKKL